MIVNEKYLPITINHLKIMPKKIIIKLEGYDHISDSEKILGEKIYIKKSDLKSLEDGEYYWHDLEGLDIYTTRNIILEKLILFLIMDQMMSWQSKTIMITYILLS